MPCTKGYSSAANPACRCGLQSLRPVYRVAELVSFGFSTEVPENTSVAVGSVGGLPVVLSVVGVLWIKPK